MGYFFSGIVSCGFYAQGKPISMFELILTFLGCLFFAGIFRFLPHIIAPHGLGVDHWFWKIYIEKYRKDKVFPPVLKQFLLDEHQWYPPVFPLFINLFPGRIFDRYSHFIALGIDLLRLSLLLSVIYFITGRLNSVLLAGVIYALTPILISYNTQLNPRGLGALFLDFVVLAVLWILFHTGGGWALVCVFFFSGLILLTHKMTTQLFWFICLAAPLLSGEWWLLGLIPCSVVSALLLSKGFYWKVLRAHWDIVTFWNRNWRWLGVHPIKNSPLYGKKEDEFSAGFFRSGWRGILRRLWFITGFNPWLYTALFLAAWEALKGYQFLHAEIWLGFLSLIFVFILITTYISVFKCLGFGYLYLYHSAFPAALFISILWGGLIHDWLVNIILIGSLAACTTGIGFYYYMLTKSKTLKLDQDMHNAMNFLREQADGVVVCLPQHWQDAVAYHTGKDVLAGGHGYGFRKLEFIFQRWMLPVKEVVSQYHVKYLLTYESYLPKHFLDEFIIDETYSFGDYRLYFVKES